MKKQSNRNAKQRWSAFLDSVWLFPALLAISLLVLTTLQISGTSVGIYNEHLYGSDYHDPDLLYGKPQPIRSDEWLGWTQNTTTQEQSGFPSFNKKIGNDGDLTKNSEIPTSGWTALLRPQNLGFFILPFENAFAFKWWFILFLLMTSAYFFILKLLPGKRLIAAILAICFSFSPFILWWYQSPLFIAMTAGFVTLILGMRLIDDTRFKIIPSALASHTIHTFLLAYTFAVTGLTLYPPYSLSVLLVAAAFLFGYLIDKTRKKKHYKYLLLRSSGFIFATLLTVGIGLVYYLQHTSMIEATAHSLYPGARRVVSGDLKPFATVDGFLMPLLQSGSRAVGYYTNQSEASNFIIALPIMLVAAVVVGIYTYIRTKRIDYVLLVLALFGILLLLRALVKFDTPLYHLLLLDRIPNIRLRSGMGFLAFVLLVVTISRLHSSEALGLLRKYLPAALGGITLVISLLTAGYIWHRYPVFAGSKYLVASLAALYTVIVWTLFTRRLLLGSLLFLLFTVGSTFKILPLYHGLGPLADSQIVQTIKQISPSGSRWATTDDLYFLNFPAMAGRYSISGSQNYPDLNFWEKVGGEKYKNIYNRQARVIFVTDPTMKEKMRLVAPNYYQVKFECSAFVVKNIDYVLGSLPIDSTCVHLVKTLVYPKQTLYFYEVNE